MSLTTTLISKLSGLDEIDARRIMLSVRAQDDLTAMPPAEFRGGRSARAWALAVVMARNPVRFWIGLAGLLVFPAYLIFQIGAWIHG